MKKLSRRSAVQHLAWSTIGLSIAPSVSLNACQELMADSKLGVALVGLGNYATLQLGPALQHTQYCELKAIVTGTPEKESKWAEEYNIDKKNIYNYDNFDSIKDNPSIDIVYIVLPNFMHAEYAIRAAKAGKHVICEKPMAMSSIEGKAIIEACKQAKKKLQVGYRLYYEPHHVEMRRLNQDGHFGNILLAESSFGFPMADPNVWRLKKAYGGWGALGDLGVYCIQGVRRTLGELPISVRAKAITRNKAIFKDIHEMVMWQMTFPSGAVSNSTTTYTSYVDSLWVSGDKGWAELQPTYNAMGLKGRTNKGNMNFDIAPYQQIAQMDAFAQDILLDRTPLASGEEGLIDLQIIETIMKAVESGQEETIIY